MSIHTFSILKRLDIEHARSLQIHPPEDWDKMTPAKMLEAGIDEVWEVQAAIQRRDVTGPHGIVNELIQAANVFLRMAAEMERREYDPSLP